MVDINPKFLPVGVNIIKLKLKNPKTGKSENHSKLVTGRTSLSTEFVAGWLQPPHHSDK